MFRRAPLALLVALAAATPVAAWARLATVPLEVITVAVPVLAAPLCHEATDELSAASACAMCASCHVPPAPPAAPAAAGSASRPAVAPAPREAERRSTRRQAERLDRPPFIRPM